MITDSLKGKKIIIYGTGHVGRKFYRALQARGMGQQVTCFVRTRDVGQNERLDGVRVCRFDDIRMDEDDLICLAVHESIRGEIEETVRQRTDHYLWIYPHLYELMFGEPECRDVELPVEALFGDFGEDLRLGVRLAAIEWQDGLNGFGSESYVRAQMLHCDKETALRRLEQFQRLIEDWKRSGYRKCHRLALTRGYGVIDGNHRLAMAVYTGQKTIHADVYPTDLSVKQIHGQEPMLSGELLREHGFTAEEVGRLKEIQERYLKRYGGQNE